MFRCRHKRLARYFNDVDEKLKSGCGGNCDYCLNPRKTREAREYLGGCIYSHCLLMINSGKCSVVTEHEVRVKRYAEEILLDSDDEEIDAKRRPLRPIRGNIEDRKTIRRMSQSRGSQDSVQSVHSPMGIIEPTADRVLNLMPNVCYVLL